jgi:hypothetical protein
MASIWMQAPGKQPEKLKGHLGPEAVIGLFKIRVAKLAKANSAEVVYQDEMNAVLRLPPLNNPKASDLALAVAVPESLFVMWVEPNSPPSAPEPGQPKVLPGQGKGILITKTGAVELALPEKKS